MCPFKLMAGKMEWIVDTLVWFRLEYKTGEVEHYNLLVKGQSSKEVHHEWHSLALSFFFNLYDYSFIGFFIAL